MSSTALHQNVPNGLTALEVAKRLPVVCPGVRVFTFVVYEPAPSLADRLQAASSAGDLDVLARAEEIRKLTNDAIPYWESVLSAAWASLRFDFFAAQAVKHDPSPLQERTIKLTPDEVLSRQLNEEVRSLTSEQVIALDSRCEMANGQPAHLPLMDFRVLPMINDATKVVTALRAIGQRRGTILHSGRSYHYYGFEPLTQKQWIEFSSKCLLLSPMTDSRYIAHRLLAGAGSLRLTSSPRKPHIPVVVTNL